MRSMASLAEAIVDGLCLSERPLEERTTCEVSGHDAVLTDLAARSLDLMALPAAFASNIRLLEGEAETPKQRWCSSRMGDGQVVHTELDNPHVDSRVLAGGMVVIDSVDEMDMCLMLLRESLEYRLSARAWINLYLMSGDTSNFGLHFDTFDTIVVQLLGQKAWMVGDRSQPEGSEVDPDADYPLTKVELTPGAVLAMPARALHNATGVGVFTMHLTIGFDRTAAVPYLTGQVDRLFDEPRSRVTAQQLEIAKARITERRRGSSLPFDPAEGFMDGASVRWGLRLPPYLTTELDGTVAVTSGSHTIRVSEPPEVRLVKRLATGDEVDVRALLDEEGRDAGSASVLALLRQLADLDLIILRLTPTYGL